MRKSRWLLILVACAIGCNSWRTVKEDNPVMGPPPPRKPGALKAADDSLSYVNDPLQPTVEYVPPGEVVHTVGNREQSAGKAAVSGETVVARVNGRPIFASDALSQYSVQLGAARASMSEEEFEKLRQMLIQRDVPSLIQRELLVQAMKAKLNAQQVAMMDQQADRIFRPELDRLLKEFGLNSAADLEKELMKQDLSLSGLKRSHMNQQLAIEYLHSRTDEKPKFSRADLLKYYREHIEDYVLPERARWQQIDISFNKHNGRRGALEVLERAVEELKNGADFAEIARKYSDGSNAQNGGQWDWTQIDSLADRHIAEALRDLSPGMISPVFEGNRGYQLVRLMEHQPAGYRPFEEVQAEIKEILERQHRRDAIDELLRELHESAEITTIFDGSSEGGVDFAIPK